MSDSCAPFRLYAGSGEKISVRGTKLPLFDMPKELHAPEKYLADEGLRNAVNVALMLGQPLCITGEPGTGKTELAASVAHELELPPPLRFNAKTTSAARDLFYRYDALGHFHASHFRQEETPADGFIHFEALGLAILLANSPAESDPYLPEELRGKGPTRSVVLIDEIDKAPRDLPNDVLNEIMEMEFTVAETGRKFSADQQYRPILILTSNSEKNLPDAFLRRCAFYHIPFPKSDRLKQIVSLRLGECGLTSDTLDAATDHFLKIRELALTKKPATAEYMDWLRVLAALNMDVAHATPEQLEALALTYCVLAKNKDDLGKMRDALKRASL